VTPAEVEALEEFRRTLAEYRLAGDRGRIAELVAVFADDGVLEVSGTRHEGHDAIRDFLSGVGRAGSGPRPAFIQHHLTTSSITFENWSHARGDNYFLVTSPLGVDHCGRYKDTYRRVGDRWLIAERKATVTWASLDSVLGARA
jgi:hypothetical protein